MQLPYKIFGVGLSRTGTTSLSDVFKRSGINIIHYPTRNQLFDRTSAGACDIPVSVRFEELDKKFPNSKFIYTIRDKESWLNSMEKYIERKANWKVGSWMTENRISIYGQMTFNRELYSDKFDEYDERVRSYFKDRPEDLLTINIVGGDKAEVLFNFLGIKSAEEFPHSNKRSW